MAGLGTADEAVRLEVASRMHVPALARRLPARVPGGRDSEGEQGWAGGFDIVFGNPPWDRVKLQEKEFFAARSPESPNAPNKAARERLIKALDETSSPDCSRRGERRPARRRGRQPC